MFSLLLAIIYLAFISLGLPDALLGSAWPSMYQELSVPFSYAGIISMIISLGTILSSLQSDRLTRRFGTGLVTAVSVAMTAAGLFGFSISRSFLLLCLWAIPYGFGAGSVDASINNYVAVHYSSRHMNWLHCMWGVGAAIGPSVMAYALDHRVWQTGYRLIALFQAGLTLILCLSLPLWKHPHSASSETSEAPEDSSSTPSDSVSDSAPAKALSIPQVLKLSGAKARMVTFFCYCALEQTTGLWASSYLVLHHGVSEQTAAAYASLFYLGITAGRALAGFISNRLGDHRMIRLGEAIILIGFVALVLPLSSTSALIGLLLIGLGCAPIYPALIHDTPSRFGSDHSQAIIGLQMASAYIGICLMPPLFGLLAEAIGVVLYPFYLLALLLLMSWMYAKSALS